MKMKKMLLDLAISIGLTLLIPHLKKVKAGHLKAIIAYWQDLEVVWQNSQVDGEVTLDEASGIREALERAIKETLAIVKG